jgi:hypothetical protein
MPDGWQALLAPVTPYAAMYGLECCGRRNLIAIVRGDAASLSLQVIAPPGGEVLGAWVGKDGGWLRRAPGACREPLPRGTLPLGVGAVLPLDAELAGLLLGGRLPTGATPIAGEPGSVEALIGDLWWRALVEGQPPHTTRVTVGRLDDSRPLLTVRLTDQRDGRPGRLRLVAGSLRADLALQGFRDSGVPVEPAWLQSPRCPGGGT